MKTSFPLILIVSSVLAFLVDGSLIVVRKESGDKVFGSYSNCSNGYTFYRTKNKHHCISTANDIGCSHFIHYRHIPTIDVQQSAQTLKAHLPTRKCPTKLAVKLQYWDDKNGNVVYSGEYSDYIFKTLRLNVHKESAQTTEKGTSQDVDVKYQLSVTLNHHFAGLLLKLSIGCHGDLHSNKKNKHGSCLLLKFKGKINHPLTRSYFFHNTTNKNKNTSTDVPSITTTINMNEKAKHDLKTIMIVVLAAIAFFIIVVASMLCLCVRKSMPISSSIKNGEHKDEMQGVGILLSDDHDVQFEKPNGGETFGTFLGALMAISPTPYFSPHDKVPYKVISTDEPMNTKKGKALKKTTASCSW